MAKPKTRNYEDVDPLGPDVLNGQDRRGKNPGRKKVLERRERRRKVAKLWASGMRSMRDIGDAIGSSSITVSRDMMWLELQWTKEARRDYVTAKAHDLHDLDQLILEHWRAYERSKGEKKIVTVRDEPQDNGKTKRIVTEQTRWEAGDPAYLRGIKDCLNLRSELRGTKEPERFIPVGSDGKTPYDAEVMITVIKYLEERAKDESNVIDVNYIEKLIEQQQGNGEAVKGDDDEKSGNGEM